MSLCLSTVSFVFVFSFRLWAPHPLSPLSLLRRSIYHRLPRHVNGAGLQVEQIKAVPMWGAGTAGGSFTCNALALTCFSNFHHALLLTQESGSRVTSVLTQRSPVVTGSGLEDLGPLGCGEASGQLA